MNNKLAFNIFKYLASFALAGGLIYILFKNQDPIKLFEEIQKVDSKWVVLSMIFGAWAYVSRGLRWIILIDSLGYQSSKLNSIASVSIGYFTNLLIPRAGEISRCTSLNQVEKTPVDKLFGTIILERVIDFIVLIIILLTTLALKHNTLFNFYSALVAQENNSSEKGITYLILLFMLVIFIASLFIAKKYFSHTAIYKKVIEFITGLKEGLASINNMKNKTSFWLHTFNIWIMYFLMTYICFFSMQETSHLTLADGLFVLVLGGIGMVIPTPGGVGSYHAIVMIGLSVLGVGTIYLGEGGDPSNPALLFPTIVHVAQTLVAIIMGSIGLLILFLSKKKKDVAS